MTPIDFLNRAHEIAPTPGVGGTRDDWMRHYAAQALAAFAGFKVILPGVDGTHERPELGYLAILGHTSAAAVIALDAPSKLEQTRMLWEHEDAEAAEEYVVGILDRLGINPADIDGRYTASDFTSPSRAVAR